MAKKYYEGISVAIVMGSESDLSHARKLKEKLDKWDIPSYYRIGSAHRTPAHVLDIVDELNKSSGRLLVVSIAGGTDALSGELAANSRWPVISCPPDKDNIQSCLNNPTGSPNATIAKPENVARFAAQYFSSFEQELAEKLLKQVGDKREAIIEADKKYRRDK